MLAGTHLYNMQPGRLRCDTEGKTHNNTYNCPLLVNVSSFQTVMKIHLQLIPWKKKKEPIVFSRYFFFNHTILYVLTYYHYLHGHQPE